MILKSLIKDDSKITFDCAKATLSKGGKIEISDEFWLHQEVQGAIKLNLVELVGSPPFVDSTLQTKEEIKMKYKNVYSTALAFECVKGTVKPGAYIEIPLSKTDHQEIMTAVSMGWLVDEDNPVTSNLFTKYTPAILEEIKITDKVNTEKIDSQQNNQIKQEKDNEIIEKKEVCKPAIVSDKKATKKKIAAINTEEKSKCQKTIKLKEKIEKQETIDLDELFKE